MRSKYVVGLVVVFSLMMSGISLAQDSADCEPGFRLFTHELLASEPVCIPENPARIAVQDVAGLELLFSTGHTPVAVVGDLVGGLFSTLPAPYGEEIIARVSEITNIGGFTLNYEALLSSNPDIILFGGYFGSRIDEGALEQLSAIAPVVYTKSHFWQETTPLYADALNLGEEAQALLDSYHARVATFQEITEGRFEGASVALISYSPERGVTILLPGDRAWQTLADIGFSAPPAMPATAEEALERFGGYQAQISIEELPLIDADYIVNISPSYTPEEAESIRQEVIESLATDPLWNTLSAIQSEQLFVTGPHWLTNGALEAHIVLDEIFGFFAGVDAAEIAPNPYHVIFAEPVEE